MRSTPKIMLRVCIFILICGFLSSGALAAEDKPALPTFDSLKQTDTGTVETVLDGLTLILKDGRVVRLSSLDIPGFVYPQPSVISIQAKALLTEKFPTGTDILLYQTIKPKVGRVNRMEQILTHVTTKDKSLWAQGVLVEAGLARVAPTPENPEMADELYNIEKNARTEKKGLWASDAYPVLNEENAGQGVGQFAVVEGIIEKAASVKNKLYLNFGDNWRTDFTVMLSTNVRKEMVRAGIDPLSLQGQRVRVRGWVREYNGPLIELNHPLSLQLLKNSPEAPTVPEEALKN